MYGASKNPAAIENVPSSITTRGPNRSIMRPIVGLKIDETTKPNENAPAVTPRSQWNSSRIGAVQQRKCRAGVDPDAHGNERYRDYHPAVKNRQAQRRLPP